MAIEINKDIIKELVYPFMSITKTLTFESNKQNIDNYILKLKVAGYKVRSVVIKNIRNTQDNKQRLYAVYKEKEIKLISSEQISIVWGSSLFEGCKLKTIDFSHVSIDKLERADGMFKDSYFERLELSNKTLNLVTNIYEIFYNIDIKELNIHDINMNNNDFWAVTKIFRGARIKNLTINNIELTSLRHISNIIDYTYIENILINNINTPNLESMQNLCENAVVKNLQVHNWKTPKLRSLIEAFSNSHIDKVDLSSIDTSNVETTNDMFHYADIKTIIIDRIHLGKLIEAKRMFKYTISDEVTIKNIVLDKLSETGLTLVFEGSNIKRLTLNNIKIPAQQFLYNFMDCKIKTLEISKMQFKVKETCMVFEDAEIDEIIHDNTFDSDILKGDIINNE